MLMSINETRAFPKVTQLPVFAHTKRAKQMFPSWIMGIATFSPFENSFAQPTLVDAIRLIRNDWTNDCLSFDSGQIQCRIRFDVDVTTGPCVHEEIHQAVSTVSFCDHHLFF